MRVYLDLCALKRPFDAPRSYRVVVEALAVAALVRESEQGRLEIIGSTALDLENSKNPNQERRDTVAVILGRLHTVVPADNLVMARARQIERQGIRPMDALHVACAERVRCRYFVTCDDKLLRAGTRLASNLKVEVVSPPEIVSVL